MKNVFINVTGNSASHTPSAGSSGSRSHYSKKEPKEPGDTYYRDPGLTVQDPEYFFMKEKNERNCIIVGDELYQILVKEKYAPGNRYRSIEDVLRVKYGLKPVHPQVKNYASDPSYSG